MDLAINHLFHLLAFWLVPCWLFLSRNGHIGKKGGVLSRQLLLGSLVSTIISNGLTKKKYPVSGRSLSLVDVRGQTRMVLLLLDDKNR